MIALPILILGYKRPNQLDQLLSQLKGIRTGKIYISIDAAEEGNNEILRSVEKCRSLALEFARSRESVFLLFHQKHQGCYAGVKAAVDWFFESESVGIILEDDLIVSRNILKLASNLVSRTLDEYSVGSISLYRASPYNLNKNLVSRPTLSPYPASWGWITWADKWRLMITELPIGLDGIHLRFKFLQHGGIVGYRRWSRIAKQLNAGELDSWAYRWLFTHWLRGWKTLVSPNNIIENDGFGKDATHTKQGVSQKILDESLYIEDATFVNIDGKTKKAILEEIYGIPSIWKRIRDKKRSIWAI